MLKKRIFIAIGLLLCSLYVLIFIAWKHAKNFRREPIVLMNKFYRLKEKHPIAAEKSLQIILQQDDSYLPAHLEFSQWMLKNNNPQKALYSLERLHQSYPENTLYSLQLANVYYVNGDWDRSAFLLKNIVKTETGIKKIEAQNMLNSMNSYLPYYQYQAVIDHSVMQRQPILSSSDVVSTPTYHSVSAVPLKNDNLFNKFYALKERNQTAAQGIIQKIIKQQPNNVNALKEGAFLAIKQDRRIEAIHYLIQVYNLTHDPSIAMQLAYLFEQINDKPNAYQFFRLATLSTDHSLSLCAENAMTNMAGQQTKGLPRPFYSELYFNPFSQTRFGITVVPMIWRFGIEQNNRYQTKQYIFTRRTQDNRSENLGLISQIYEDNVQISGVGGQFSPFQHFPLIGFVEVGAAYDLIYLQRNPWRGDVRTGVMYYQNFGTPPAYYDHVKFSHDYYSDWYGDITYFSRYNNNVIGLFRTHQGIRLMQYHSSMLNLYVTGRVIADTNRIFYNNIAEVGPGISIVPSNRFNMQIRLEQINGMYLPAGAIFNPYKKFYTNELVQFLFYAKI